MIVLLSLSFGIYAQKPLESKLDVGKTPQKVELSTTNTILFSGFPNKLNLDSKVEYTQFYRNWLLNSPRPVTANSVESVDNSSKSNSVKSQEKTVEKVKFGKIFPNPADTYATLSYEIKSGYKNAAISILNMVGETVLEYQVSQNSSEVKINTSKLASGIYMVQSIVDGKKVMTQKLLVEHN